VSPKVGFAGGVEVNVSWVGGGPVGDEVGGEVGGVVGAEVGADVGAEVGALVGALVGADVGTLGVVVALALADGEWVCRR
jgi:hypothetical protein